MSNKINLISEASISTDFQTSEPPDSDDSRHYFETRALTLNVNRNFFQVKEPAMQQMAEGYKKGLPLAVNHDKFESLGIGQTTNAAIENDELFIQAYIKKGLQFTNGPFRNSEDYITGITDGFIKNVSVSFGAKNITCSVCENDPRDWQSCSHIRGEDYTVGQGKEKRTVTAVWEVHDADPMELSLVQVGADADASIVKKAVNLFYEGYIDAEKLKTIRERYGENESVKNELESLGDSLETINSATNTSTKLYASNIDPPELRATYTQSSISKGESSMSTETQEFAQIKLDNASLKEENATIKAENVRIQADLTALRTENTSLRSEREEFRNQAEDQQAKTSEIEQRNSTLTTENETLTVKVETLEQNKQVLTERIDASKKTEAGLQTKISELEAQIASNQLFIDDGRAARVEAEREYVNQYVRYKGESCSTEDKDRQTKHAQTLPLVELRATATSFKEAADAKYEPGRKVRTDETVVIDQTEDTETTEDRAVGVGY